MHYLWRTARCLHVWRLYTIAAINTRRQEWLAAELKARDDENKAEIDSLREVLKQESHRKHAEIDRLHNANEYLRKAQQANSSVQNSGHEQLAAQVALLQELLRITNSSIFALEDKCKVQERELETLRIENARKSKSATEHEAEMYEVRVQLEKQMQELRVLHNEHVAGAAVKDQLLGELEQTKAVLQQKEDLLVQLQTHLEDQRHVLTQERIRMEEQLSKVKQSIKDRDQNMARQEEELVKLRGTVRRKEDDEKRYLQQVHQLYSVLTQERMRMEEELSQVKQSIKDSDRNMARQEEELVMLRGTVCRKVDDEKRYLQQVQQLRDVISGKEDAYQVIEEQNRALVHEVRAKDEKIVSLQSGKKKLLMSIDVRTLVHEHEVIVERFQAQALELQTENSHLEFAGDQMKVEVNKIHDELRLQVMSLPQSEDAAREKQSLAELEAERRIQMCKRVVQRMLRHQLLVAWNMFVDTVIEMQHNRKTMRKVLSRTTHRTLAGAFDCYAGAVQTVLAQRELVARKMARWKAPGLKMAMDAWTEYLEIMHGERAQELQELARQSMQDMVDKRTQELQESYHRQTVTSCMQDMVDLEEQVRRWKESLDSLADESKEAMAKQVKLALHAINRKDEERNGLKKELIEAGEAIEDLKNKVQELAGDAEEKQKAIEELQSTMRGKDEERNGLKKELIEAGEAIEDLKKQVQELAGDAEEKQKAMEELQSTMRGKDEERNGLKKELIEAGEAIEDLKKQVQELAGNAEEKQKAMEELQSTMRGKAQLEKRGPLAK